jgi:hypothetical protein
MTPRQERIADTAKHKLDAANYCEELAKQFDYLRQDKLNNAELNAYFVRKYTVVLEEKTLEEIENTRRLIAVYDRILNNLITQER